MRSPEEQLALVQKALTDGLVNCVEWKDDRTVNRVLGDPANQGLTPHWIRNDLIRQVRAGEAQVQQRREDREQWRVEREFWYRVILSVEGFPRGLFVEIVLEDDDEDVPVVSLVNAHPHR
jgi:hypothetical protein